MIIEFLGEKLTKEEIRTIVNAFNEESQGNQLKGVTISLREAAMPYARAIQIARDYIENDVEGASEISYVRDILYDNIGCSDDELEALGISYLIPDE